MKSTLTKVYENLYNTGIPTAYFNFDTTEEISIPFIILRNTKKIISADSDIYLYSNDFNIELYYNGDEKIEKKFRNALYEVKKVIGYEQSPLNDGIILLRATFNLLEDKEKAKNGK